MGLNSNSCLSQLLQPCFGHPGGEWFPWGSSSKSLWWSNMESWGLHALCWAIPCVGRTISGKLLLKWNVLFSAYSHTLKGWYWCQFFKSPPSLVPWRQLTTVEHHLIQLSHCWVSTTWEEWGPLAGLCSAFAPRPENSHLFNYRVFFCVQFESFLPGSDSVWHFIM